MPDKSLFTAKFILQVNRWEKKLIPNAFAKPPVLYQSKNNKSFDKKALFSYISRDPEMMKYLPEKSTYNNLERSFMLSVSS